MKRLTSALAIAGAAMTLCASLVVAEEYKISNSQWGKDNIGLPQ